MSRPWSDYTPMGRALIYVRDCIKLCKTTTTADYRLVVQELIMKRSNDWTKADLTAVASGAIMLLAEKLCPGESVSQPERPSIDTESTPTTPTSGQTCTATNEIHSAPRLKQ